ncbi:MAG: DUF2283 domain-containing protein [Nitrospira sp.]|nr:DUF2283 domain-containing protein [Nitrospira sp.]
MRKATQKDEHLEFNEVYDQEDDIYYVTLKTGEPSYCVEIDDMIVAEVGMFTNAFTGFRVLNYAKNRAAINQVYLSGKLKQQILRRSKKSENRSRQAREAAFDHALEKVLA